MKVTLTVAQGVHEGKAIAVALPQFLIGRDPQCQLRPASLAISKRHCAVLTRGDKVFARDFESTNGTSVNETPLKGEVELKDGDLLKVGPLLFRVGITADVPAEKAVVATREAAAPAPAAAAAGASAAAGSSDSDEDDMAALLLGMGEGDTSGAGGLAEDSVPGGSTVMEVPAMASEGTKTDGTPAKPGAKKDAKLAANTSSAAEAILKKYMRRPRA